LTVSIRVYVTVVQSNGLDAIGGEVADNCEVTGCRCVHTRWQAAEHGQQCNISTFNAAVVVAHDLLNHGFAAWQKPWCGHEDEQASQ
jgi:hypothetical protein